MEGRYFREYQLQIESRKIKSNSSPGQITIRRASILSLVQNVYCCWQPSLIKSQLSNINKDTEFISMSCNCQHMPLFLR